MTWIYRIHTNWYIYYQSPLFSKDYYIPIWFFCGKIHGFVFLWQLPICAITISPTYSSILSELLASHVNSNMLLSQSLLKLAFGKFFTIYLHLSFHCCWPFLILRTLLTFFLLFHYFQSTLQFVSKKIGLFLVHFTTTLS